MKFLKQIPILVTVILLVVFVAGCSGMTLTSPTGLAVDEDRSVALLTWDEVPNATYYKLNITQKGQNGKADSQRTVTLAKAYYSLLSLDGGYDYLFKVKAFDAKGEYLSSDWSKEFSYAMPAESGLQYSLTNANTEYTVTGIGTAKGNIVIGDTYKGKPVTSIADRAFYSKSAITDITISSNIKTIGKYAFTGCSNLKSVTFEGDVESIGDYAFQSCSSLTSINLPNTVTEIGKYTFRYCRHLTSVTLGDNTVSIGEEAFMQCTRLASINFPATLTTIGPSAFGYCEALTSVELGNAVTEIGKGAFVAASNLETVRLGNSLQIIGESAFEKCEKIVSLEIPDSVTAIGDSAFYDCTSLFDVKLGSGVVSIGRYAFVGSKFYNSPVDGVYYVGNWAIDSASDVAAAQTAAGVEKTVREGTIGIADSAFRSRAFSTIALPDSVLYIGQSAFRNCGTLTSINLGSNVKVISESAFRDCKQLGRGRINLGTKLEEIGNYAFGNCTDFGTNTYMNLFYKNFKLPNTVKTVGMYAFLNSGFWSESATPEIYVGQWLVGYKVSSSDTDQRTVSVKDGTVGISNYAFYKKTLVSDVVIPESVKYIGIAAFAECSGLHVVNIDMFCELEEIPDYAFYKCTALNEVSVPSTVKRIGRSAFYKSGLMVANVGMDVEEIGAYAYYGCSDLIQVIFDKNCKLESIGDYAFSRAVKLQKITLPDGVITIGKYAFSNCTSLETVSLGNSLEYLDSGVFSSCTSLKAVSLPDTLTEIAERTFYKCTSLESVEMPSVQKIGNYAFYRCSVLKNVDLTGKVTSIGDYAFFRCALEDLHIGQNVTEIGAHAFNGNTSLTLYIEASEVPQGWNGRWNSAFRPAVLGCKFDSDENGTYVVSFTKTDKTLLNFKPVTSESTSTTKYTDPTRQGYTFGGWQTTDEENLVTYTTDNLSSVPDGTELIAIWNKID